VILPASAFLLVFLKRYGYFVKDKILLLMSISGESNLRSHKCTYQLFDLNCARLPTLNKFAELTREYAGTNKKSLRILRENSYPLHI
jgi:hypothetical protein